MNEQNASDLICKELSFFVDTKNNNNIGEYDLARIFACIEKF